MNVRLFSLSLLLLTAAACTAPAQKAGDLARSFAHPPESARPWVYWFWLNGNITREGITADLEAMKRVGIGGVLIMEVDQGVPRGPVDFMSDRWRELFRHVVSEAGRLGLEVNMNDDAGWNGSGGPWITPEQSMQKLVWTETAVGDSVTASDGQVRRIEATLPKPPAIAGFYRDVAVLAFPTPADYQIPGIQEKAAFTRAFILPLASHPTLPRDQVVPKEQVTDLTARMDSDGRLVWTAPAGRWTILRIGHTSTGAVNAPSPKSGLGLECDKLSKEGSEAHFAGMMAKLISDVGPAAGKALVATHVDSWENGMQNWTARMREEFRKRRGYDPLPYLPVVTGRAVQSLDVSERFLWDFRQTISDLTVENYAGHLRDLARQRGLRLSIEAYDGPCDDMTYAGRADEPMCEFWIGGGAFQTCKEMASAAHTYGKRILGAEAFTADNHERWQEHPGSIKALGDRAFCEGVNRFVFHRYALQPWLNYRPGMTMGPWGLHYERTNTWWEFSRPWHEYLARCQYLLRQGLFVADICYLQPEASPQGFQSHSRRGYDFDNCTPEVALTRMSVKDGRIVLPDGMSYRALALPDAPAMTPQLLHKIRDLIAAGATVIGARPQRSPSLSGYPDCDAEVKRLAQEIWGDCDGKSIKEHTLGRGRVICGTAPEEFLEKSGVAPDFSGRAGIRWIHRRVGDKDVYFVANGSPFATEGLYGFRARGKRPEFWDAEFGRISQVPAYEERGRVTRIPIRLEAGGSVFVVFRPARSQADQVVRLSKDGHSILPVAATSRGILIRHALWGPAGDTKRTRDVTEQVRRLIASGASSFRVADLASEGDPAVNVLKTLRVEYQAGNRVLTTAATDSDTVSFDLPAEPVEPLRMYVRPDGSLVAEAAAGGSYEAVTKLGRTIRFRVPAPPRPLEVAGPWQVSFPPNAGAPQRITLERLIPLSEHSDGGVRYFSGAAGYSRVIDVPQQMMGKSRRIYLDLGRVAVICQVKLNGKDLGVMWKSPYRLDVTDFVRAGANRLEVRVANLWINRMIGDEHLAEDSARNPDGTLREMPPWVNERKPSPTGRHTFTTWRLWKKDEKLPPSGLLGPVRLTVTETIALRPASTRRISRVAGSL